MTREEAKALLPIIQGYVDGKNIEIRRKGKYNAEWKETHEPSFTPSLCDYRIKLESKYRSFKDAEECWQEMLKHQPFGWIKSKTDDYYFMVTVVGAAEKMKCIAISGNNIWPFDKTMSDYTFADGTPFGVRENL